MTRTDLARVAAGVAVVLGLGVAVAAASGRGEPVAMPTPEVSSSSVPSASASPSPEVSADGPSEGEGSRDPAAGEAHDATSNDASIPVPASGAEVAAGDRPVEVVIPAIGVRSSLVDLGIARDGTMQVPSDFARAGWLTAAPAPGQRGPAVIAGHVDSHEGPAVFFRLSELVAGDEVRVVQADGDVVSFTVRGKESFAKDEFPTDRVYGPVPGPVLRLITCSGEVDPVSGHYVDNTVVFAS